MAKCLHRLSKVEKRLAELEKMASRFTKVEAKKIEHADFVKKISKAFNPSRFPRKKKAIRADALNATASAKRRHIPGGRSFGIRFLSSDRIGVTQHAH